MKGKSCPICNTKLHWLDKKAKTWKGDTVHAWPCLGIFIAREQKAQVQRLWEKFLQELAK